MAKKKTPPAVTGGASRTVHAGELNVSDNIKPATTRKSWRDWLPVHPAADLFPAMSPDELKALGEDIKKHGLRERVAVVHGGDGKPILIDGRNRLDAMEAVGQPFTLHVVATQVSCLDGDFDPYSYVTSINLRRRHLTAEQRIEVAEKLAKANPTMSARRIAKLADIAPTTAVKAKARATGDVSTVDTSISIDTRGRRQPAKKARVPRHLTHVCWHCRARAPVGEVQKHSYPDYEDTDIWLHDACVAAFESKEAADKARRVAEDDAEMSAEARKAAYAEDEDPDWKRKNRLDVFIGRAKAAVELDAVLPIEPITDAEWQAVIDAADAAAAAYARTAQGLRGWRQEKPAAVEDDLDGIPPFLRRTS